MDGWTDEKEKGKMTKEDGWMDRRTEGGREEKEKGKTTNEDGWMDEGEKREDDIGRKHG